MAIISHFTHLEVVTNTFFLYCKWSAIIDQYSQMLSIQMESHHVSKGERPYLFVLGNPRVSCRGQLKAKGAGCSAGRSNGRAV